MSGAPKAGNIAGCITVCAEVNAKITFVTAKVGSTKLSKILMISKVALANKEIVSIAYLGNVVDVWEKRYYIDLGSDQTSYIIRTQEDIIQLTFLLRMRMR
jgi:urocanate hydratase